MIIPYVDHQKDKNDVDISTTMSSTLPMAAMFTRNKMIGWASFVFALQTWLAGSPEQSRKSSTPGYLSVGMAFLALCVTYLPLFMPPNPARTGMTGTEAPPAIPPS